MGRLHAQEYLASAKQTPCFGFVSLFFFFVLFFLFGFGCVYICVTFGSYEVGGAVWKELGCGEEYDQNAQKLLNEV